MKKILLAVIIALLFAMPLAAAQEFTPNVEFEHQSIAVIGNEFIINVTISDTYIESSVIEIDMDPLPGWGQTEKNYFDFIAYNYSIDKLETDEILKITFIVKVEDDAPEKDFSMPVVFYGKAGECAEGCMPFRLSYIIPFSTLDPSSAAKKEANGDEAYDKEEYSLAAMYFQQAKTLYEAVGNEGKAGEAADKISASEIGVNAAQLFENGKSKFQVGNKTGALDDFEGAKEGYEKIGNASKVSELNSWIELCQESPSQPNGEDGGSSNTLYILAILLLIVIVAVPLIKKYK